MKASICGQCRNVLAYALPGKAGKTAAVRPVALRRAKRQDRFDWLKSPDLTKEQLLAHLQSENKHTASCMSDTLPQQQQLQYEINQMVFTESFRNVPSAASHSSSSSTGDSISPSGLVFAPAYTTAGRFAFYAKQPKGALHPTYHRAPLPDASKALETSASDDNLGHSEPSSPRHDELLLVDFNSRAVGSASYELHGIAPSPDGRYVAWTEKHCSSKRVPPAASPGDAADFRLMVHDTTAAGGVAVCLLEAASGLFVWAADSSHIFATTEFETCVQLVSVLAPMTNRNVYTDPDKVRVVLEQVPIRTAACSSGNRDSSPASISVSGVAGVSPNDGAVAAGGSQQATAEASDASMLTLTTLGGHLRACEVQYKLPTDEAAAPWRALVPRQHAGYCQVRCRIWRHDAWLCGKWCFA